MKKNIIRSIMYKKPNLHISKKSCTFAAEIHKGIFYTITIIAKIHNRKTVQR